MEERIEVNAEFSPGDRIVINFIEKAKDKESYSLSEFSELSKLSRTTIFRKIKNSEIKVIRDGKQKKIEHKYLEQLKNKLKNKS